MSVRHARDVETQAVKAGDRTTIQVLVSSEEGPNFALRRFTMAPGGGMLEHTNTVEHEQYVLQGRANIGIGEDVHEVRAGDVVFIPEGVPHWYQNIGEEDFVFLCIVPNKEDVIEILDKGC